MNNPIPNISAKANATSFAALQEQMKAAISEAATASANEIGKLMQLHCKVLKKDIKESEGIVPEFNDRYVQAGVLAATFRFLREEFATAYMRVESVQADKMMCRERLNGVNEGNPLGNCRNDVEFASVTRSLEYYDTLDQRLEEISNGLAKCIAAYEKVCEEQRTDDDARQQDVPQNERKYASMPQLRWVSNADKDNDPKNWMLNDDIKAAHRQAERFIEWNWNRS